MWHLNFFSLVLLLLKQSYHLSRLVYISVHPVHVIEVHATLLEGFSLLSLLKYVENTILPKRIFNWVQICCGITGKDFAKKRYILWKRAPLPWRFVFISPLTRGEVVGLPVDPVLARIFKRKDSQDAAEISRRGHLKLVEDISPFCLAAGFHFPRYKCTKLPKRQLYLHYTSLSSPMNECGRDEAQFLLLKRQHDNLFFC